jgi:hypothetical protein
MAELKTQLNDINRDVLETMIARSLEAVYERASDAGLIE